MTPHSRELADRLEARAKAYGRIGVEGGNDGYYSAANAADDLEAAALLRREPSVEEVEAKLRAMIYLQTIDTEARVVGYGQAAQAVAALWGRDSGSLAPLVPTEGQSSDSGSRRDE